MSPLPKAPPPSLPNDFPKRLQTLRKHCRVDGRVPSLKALARRIRASSSTVRAWEEGRQQPNVVELYMLRGVVGVELPALTSNTPLVDVSPSGLHSIFREGGEGGSQMEERALPDRFRCRLQYLRLITRVEGEFLSQQALSKRIPAGVNAVHRWESGRYVPTRQVLLRLADELGVTPRLLYEPAARAWRRKKGWPMEVSPGELPDTPGERLAVFRQMTHVLGHPLNQAELAWRLGYRGSKLIQQIEAGDRSATDNFPWAKLASVLGTSAAILRCETVPSEPVTPRHLSHDPRHPHVQHIRSIQEDELPDSLPDRLRFLREHSLVDGESLSRSSLARYLGVGGQAVADWEESVAVPRKRNLERLARFFEVPFEWLASAPLRRDEVNPGALKTEEPPSGTWPESLAERLRELRRRKRINMYGMSQRDLAMKIGVSPGLVGHWEAGYSDISERYRGPVADALRIEKAEIGGRVDPETRRRRLRFHRQRMYVGTRARNRRELAEQVGSVTATSLRRWERGEELPPFVELARLAGHFDVAWQRMIGGLPSETQARYQIFDLAIAGSVGDKIWVCRRRMKVNEKREVSQLELGKRLGVSDQTFSNWERNRCFPKRRRWKPLAELLNVEVADLFSHHSEYRRLFPVEESSLAARIRAYRERREVETGEGWSQARLADELDVLSSWVSQWERGKRPVAEVHRKPLAKALNTSVEVLLGEETAS